MADDVGMAHEHTKDLINQWCCVVLMFNVMLRSAEALCTNPKAFSADIDMTRHNVQFHPPGAGPPEYCIINIIQKKIDSKGSDKHSKRTPIHMPYDAYAVINPCLELWYLYNHGDPVPKSEWSETPLFRDPKTGKPLSYYTHMLNLLRYMISKLGGLLDPNLYALHSNRIGGTSAAMKSKCPQHMT